MTLGNTVTLAILTVLFLRSGPCGEAHTPRLRDPAETGNNACVTVITTVITRYHRRRGLGGVSVWKFDGLDARSRRPDVPAMLGAKQVE